MKREISGTSIATAILLVVAAILLCTQLQKLEATGIGLPPPATLLIEGAFYVGIIYLWCGRFHLRAQALGLAVLLALRIIISAGAIAGAQLDAGHRPQVAWDKALAPVWQSWMVACAFAVIAFHLVRGVIVRGRQAAEAPAVKESAPSRPAASKVMFDSAPPEAARHIEITDHGGGEAAGGAATLFEVLEPRRTSAPSAPLAAPVPQVEGWVSVPVAVIAEQLPPGAQVTGDELLIPLALIMPKLRTGAVRIPLAELEGISAPLATQDDEASVELPLRLIVPQLPDEVLELRQAQPPSWLAVDAALEDIFFAKV